MDADIVEPARQSIIHFYYNALGLKYAVLLPFAALIAFVMTLLLVWRGKGSHLVPAVLVALSLPVLVGIYSFFDGLISSFQVIATATTSPKPSEWAQGISMSLVGIQVGMFLALPTYLLAIVGMVIRAVISKGRSSLTGAGHE